MPGMRRIRRMSWISTEYFRLVQWFRDGLHVRSISWDSWYRTRIAISSLSFLVLITLAIFRHSPCVSAGWERLSLSSASPTHLISRTSILHDLLSKGYKRPTSRKATAPSLHTQRFSIQPTNICSQALRWSSPCCATFCFKWVYGGNSIDCTYSQSTLKR